MAQEAFVVNMAKEIPDPTEHSAVLLSEVHL